MFSAVVPSDVIGHSYLCHKQVNLGRRGDGSDGTEDQQMIGIIGQNMVLRELNKPLMKPSTGHDGGVDFNLFGLRFDVKTMGRRVAPKLEYVNNFIAQQMNFNVDAYLFLSIKQAADRYELTCCGWLPKDVFQRRAELFKKGDERSREDGTTFNFKADTYEIRNDQLYHKAESWAELFGQVYWYSRRAA